MTSKKGIVKKILAYSIPVLTLIIFVLILTSGTYLKAHLQAGKQLEAAMLQLEELTFNGSWSEAEAKVSELDQAWRNLSPKLQISSEEDDIREFSNSIERLKGYIKGEDSDSALAEIGSLRFTWSRLGR